MRTPRFYFANQSGIISCNNDDVKIQMLYIADKSWNNYEETDSMSFDDGYMF